jgi:hypothetical protein
MGAAEGSSCEEVRARKQWDALRGQLPLRVAQWLEALAAQLPEPALSGAQRTETVWNLRHALTGGLPEARGEQAHRGEPTRQPSRCPQGDRLVPARAPVQRTVETLVGVSQRERPSCSCPACHPGRSPLEQVLALSPGRTPRAGQQAAATLTTAGPDDEAQRFVSDWTGVGVGRERLHTCTTHVAEGLTVLDVTPSRDASERRSAPVAAGRLRRPVLGVGMDGASGPTRPAWARGRRPGPGRHRAKRAWWHGPWRDAQGVRLYRMDGERIVHGRRWQQGHHAAPRGEALPQGTEAGVMPAAQGRRCVVCDGAAWRGQPVQALLPQARQGLDASHGAQDLQRGAKGHEGLSGRA